MKPFLALAGVLAGLALIGGFSAYSGFYNVAASEPHGAIVEDLLRGAMHRSVERRARGISSPDLSEETRVSTGMDHYREMCEVCHGAPGASPSEVAEGLYPRPPQFAEASPAWNDAELFWITKHGIKMTGMPGFGATHDDDELWALVAAVKQLAQLAPEAYRPATSAPVVDRHQTRHEHHPH